MMGKAAPQWQSGPARHCLQPLEVHVWLADMAHLRQQPGTSARAMGHAALQDILMRYLPPAAPPPHVQRDALGKPYLAGTGSAKLPGFSVSYAGDMALLAFAGGGAVGVDMEQVDAALTACGIAENFYTAQERSALTACPACDLPECFFSIWTGKESYLKATGEGIASRLARVSVTPVPGSNLMLLEDPDDGHAAERWCIARLPLGSTYSGAVTMPRAAKVTGLFAWSPEQV